MAQFRGNLDDRRENVGSEHNFSLKPDLAFPLKLFLPTNFTRSNIARLQAYTRNTKWGTQSAVICSNASFNNSPYQHPHPHQGRLYKHSMMSALLLDHPPISLEHSLRIRALSYITSLHYHHHRDHQEQTVIARLSLQLPLAE